MTQVTVVEWFRVLDHRNRNPDPGPGDSIPRDVRVKWDEYTDAAVRGTAERNHAPLPHHSATVFMQHFGYYNIDAMLQPLWGVRGVLGPRAAGARRRMYQALQREETRFRVMLIGRVLCGRIRARLNAAPVTGFDALTTWFALGLCIAAIGDTRLGRETYAFDQIMALAAGQRFATVAEPEIFNRAFENRTHPKTGTTMSAIFRPVITKTPPGTWDMFTIQRARFAFIHTTTQANCTNAACTVADHRPHPWRALNPLPKIDVIMHHLDLLDFLEEAKEMGLELYATVTPGARRRPVRVQEIGPGGAVRIRFVQEQTSHVLYLHYDVVEPGEAGTDSTTFRSVIWREPGGFEPGPELNLNWMENLRVRNDFSAELMQEQHKSLEFLSTLRWPAGGRLAREGERPDAGWRDIGDPLRHIQGYLGDGSKLAPATDDRVHVLRTESSGAAASGEDEERRRKGRVAAAMNID